ncbi:MAG TPA: response regulator transcription factor [Candidatus Binataceae bacterium]|nr:response regulator transcription factor [Candidatus Binataceae bacterium]
METGTRIRVLLADDHRLMREGLRALLGAQCEIVGEAASGEEALELAAKTRPQVIVLDLQMPGIGGLAAAHHLAAISPASKVLVLSQYSDEEYVVEALAEAGVAGYLVKTDAAAELATAVQTVAAGKRYLSPTVAPIVLSRMNRPGGADEGAKLTRREREVLKLIGEGAAAKEIARRLGISPKTAEAHRENLKNKLNLRSTAAMVRYAIKHKLIRDD